MIAIEVVNVGSKAHDGCHDHHIKAKVSRIHIAFNGAQISKNWNHLIASVKQGDKAAFVPGKNILSTEM